MTQIKSELSKRSKYWISKHRFYELKHFCLQYPEWRDEYNDILLSRHSDASGVHGDTNFSDPTYSIVEKRDILARKIKLVEDCAIKADPDICFWLLKGVTEEYSFAYLKNRLGMPCERDMYYSRFRKFFYILSQRKHFL